MSKYHKSPIKFTTALSLKVLDLARSLDYYEQVIGLETIYRTEEEASLSADGERPLLFLRQPKGVQPKLRRTTGLYHFALLLRERQDLANFLAFLLEHRLPFGSADHILTEALYLEDPDGNGIELYYDKEEEELDGPVESLEMATLPLDLEDLLELRSGSWGRIPKDTIIGHMHLHVNSLEAAEDFYVDGLGFDIVARYPGALFISDGGYHHHIGLNVWNGEGAEAAPAEAVGLNWYNLVLPDEAERKRLAGRLLAKGYSVSEEGEFFLTEDPAGNVLHLTLKE